MTPPEPTRISFVREAISAIRISGLAEARPPEL